MLDGAAATLTRDQVLSELDEGEVLRPGHGYLRADARITADGKHDERGYVIGGDEVDRIVAGSQHECRTTVGELGPDDLLPGLQERRSVHDDASQGGR